MRHYYALCSGGFDSTLAILKVLSGKDPVKITPIFFDYGQKARKEETRAVTRLIPALQERSKPPRTSIEKCRIYTIESLSGGLFSWSQSSILEGRPAHKDEDLENRNTILISCVASVIMADRKESRIDNYAEIIVGFLNGGYDTTLKFSKAFNGLFKAMEKDLEPPITINIVAPLIPEGQKGGMSTKQLADIVRSLDAYDLLKEDMTWSCYYPQNNEACGECDPCRKRKGVCTELDKNS